MARYLAYHAGLLTMPTYYFDFEFNEKVYRDEEGIEFLDAAIAQKQMRLTLLDMAKQVFANDGSRQLVGTIRDEGGVLWRGCLSFETD